MQLCGNDQAECVAFVVQDSTTGELDLVHPLHTAGPGGYEIDSNWLGKFAARQATEGLIVRAQMHTHPGAAFHSSIDDRWPIVGTPGFISIVVPRFGREPIAIEDWYVCELQGDGRWKALNAQAVLAA